VFGRRGWAADRLHYRTLEDDREPTFVNDVSDRLDRALTQVYVQQARSQSTLRAKLRPSSMVPASAATLCPSSWIMSARSVRISTSSSTKKIELILLCSG
jgi:hypothetical protein